jgi:hypothetical protein
MKPTDEMIEAAAKAIRAEINKRCGGIQESGGIPAIHFDEARASLTAALADVPDGVVAVIERIAAASSSDPATDDLTVPLAIENAELQQRVRELEYRLSLSR